MEDQFTYSQALQQIAETDEPSVALSISNKFVDSGQRYVSDTLRSDTDYSPAMDAVEEGGYELFNQARKRVAQLTTSMLSPKSRQNVWKSHLSGKTEGLSDTESLVLNKMNLFINDNLPEYGNRINASITEAGVDNQPNKKLRSLGAVTINYRSGGRVEATLKKDDFKDMPDTSRVFEVDSDNEAKVGSLEKEIETLEKSRDNAIERMSFPSMGPGAAMGAGMNISNIDKQIKEAKALRLRYGGKGGRDNFVTDNVSATLKRDYPDYIGEQVSVTNVVGSAGRGLVRAASDTLRAGGVVTGSLAGIVNDELGEGILKGVDDLGDVTDEYLKNNLIGLESTRFRGELAGSIGVGLVEEVLPFALSIAATGGASVLAKKGVTKAALGNLAKERMGKEIVDEVAPMIGAAIMSGREAVGVYDKGVEAVDEMVKVAGFKSIEEAEAAGDNDLVEKVAAMQRNTVIAFYGSLATNTALEAVPLGRYLKINSKTIKDIAEDTLTQPLVDKFKSTLVSGGLEGTTEVVQGVMNRGFIKAFIDENEDLLPSTEEAFIEFAVGGLMGVAADVVLSKRDAKTAFKDLERGSSRSKKDRDILNYSLKQAAIVSANAEAKDYYDSEFEGDYEFSPTEDGTAVSGAMNKASIDAEQRLEPNPSEEFTQEANALTDYVKALNGGLPLTQDVFDSVKEERAIFKRLRRVDPEFKGKSVEEQVALVNAELVDPKIADEVKIDESNFGATLKFDKKTFTLPTQELKLAADAVIIESKKAFDDELLADKKLAEGLKVASKKATQAKIAATKEMNRVKAVLNSRAHKNLITLRNRARKDGSDAEVQDLQNQIDSNLSEQKEVIATAKGAVKEASKAKASAIKASKLVNPESIAKRKRKSNLDIQKRIKDLSDTEFSLSEFQVRRPDGVVEDFDNAEDSIAYTKLLSAAINKTKGGNPSPATYSKLRDKVTEAPKTISAEEIKSQAEKAAKEFGVDEAAGERRRKRKLRAGYSGASEMNQAIRGKQRKDGRNYNLSNGLLDYVNNTGSTVQVNIPLIDRMFTDPKDKAAFNNDIKNGTILDEVSHFNRGRKPAKWKKEIPLIADVLKTFYLSAKAPTQESIDTIAPLINRGTDAMKTGEERSSSRRGFVRSDLSPDGSPARYDNEPIAIARARAHDKDATIEAVKGRFYVITPIYTPNDVAGAEYVISLEGKSYVRPTRPEVLVTPMPDRADVETTAHQRSGMGLGGFSDVRWEMYFAGAKGTQKSQIKKVISSNPLIRNSLTLLEEYYLAKNIAEAESHDLYQPFEIIDEKDSNGVVTAQRIAGVTAIDPEASLHWNDVTESILRGEKGKYSMQTEVETSIREAGLKVQAIADMMIREGVDTGIVNDTSESIENIDMERLGVKGYFPRLVDMDATRNNLRKIHGRRNVKEELDAVVKESSKRASKGHIKKRAFGIAEDGLAEGIVYKGFKESFTSYNMAGRKLIAEARFWSDPSVLKPEVRKNGIDLTGGVADNSERSDAALAQFKSATINRSNTWVDGLISVANEGKVLITGADAGFIILTGPKLLASGFANDGGGVGPFWNAITTSFKALSNPKAADQFIESNELNIQLAEMSSYSVAAVLPQEFTAFDDKRSIANRASNKLIQAASLNLIEEADIYYRFGNSFRAFNLIGTISLWNARTNDLRGEDGKILDEHKELARVIGDDINLTMGRFDFERRGVPAAFTKTGQILLFASQLTASTLSDLARATTAPAKALAGRQTNDMASRRMAMHAVGLMGAFVSLGLLSGMDLDDLLKRLNPLDDNFMKLDVSSPSESSYAVNFGDPTVALVRGAAKAARASMGHFNVGDPEYKTDDSVLDIISTMAQNKKNPMWGLARGVVWKENHWGQQVPRVEVIMNSLAPIPIQDFSNLMAKRLGDALDPKGKSNIIGFLGISEIQIDPNSPMEQSVASIITGFIGLSAYPLSSRKSLEKDLNASSKVLYGVRFDDLSIGKASAIYREVSKRDHHTKALDRAMSNNVWMKKQSRVNDNRRAQEEASIYRKIGKKREMSLRVLQYKMEPISSSIYFNGERIMLSKTTRERLKDATASVISRAVDETLARPDWNTLAADYKMKVMEDNVDEAISNLIKSPTLFFGDQ